MRIFKQCLCAMFVVCLWSGSLLAAGVAEFKKVHGMVDVFHVGERQAVSVTVGDSLAVGDIVRTGKRSRAQLKFADGSVLNIGSLSKIQVGEFSFSADSKVRKTSISDLRGKVRALVTKSTHKDSFFQVKTPGAVAAVRGTDYGVDVISPRETVVVTYSGAVAVGTLDGFKKGKTVMVLANQITRVVKGKPPTPPATASPKVLKDMSAGTQQVESSDSSGGSTSLDSGSTTSTTTEGTVTTEGTSTTTTTTTTDGAGVTTELSTSTTSTVIPTTTVPTVGVAPAAPPAPVIVTPPITVTTPAVNTTPVGIVIQF